MDTKSKVISFHYFIVQANKRQDGGRTRLNRPRDEKEALCTVQSNPETRKGRFPAAKEQNSCEDTDVF